MNSPGNRSLRVLFVVDAFPGPDHVWDGVFFRDQAKAVARHATVGIALGRTYSPRQLFASRGRRPDETTTRQEGLDVYRRASFVLTTRSDRLLVDARVRAIDRAARQFERQYGTLDLIHAHCSAFAGETALRVGRARRIPVVITEHYTFLPELIERYGQRLLDVYEQADLAIAVSHSLANRMRELGVRRAISCVPNAVDTETFSFAPIAPPADGVWRLVNVSRDHPNKDVPNLIRAIAQLPADLQVQVTIVGGGEHQESGRLCEEHGLSRRVHFVGDVDRPMLGRIVRQSHLIVSSSCLETFGMSLAEGLCVGRPVVATDSGGPRDIVGPQDGRLIPIANARALADAIADVLGRYGEFDQAALSASARTRFGLATFADRMLEAYHGVLRLRSTQCAGQSSERLRSQTSIGRPSGGRTDRARPRLRCRQPAGEGG